MVPRTEFPEFILARRFDAQPPQETTMTSLSAVRSPRSAGIRFTF